jgi:hypothetical protein
MMMAPSATPASGVVLLSTTLRRTAAQLDVTNTQGLAQ